MKMNIYCKLPSDLQTNIDRYLFSHRVGSIFQNDSLKLNRILWLSHRRNNEQKIVKELRIKKQNSLWSNTLYYFRKISRMLLVTLDNPSSLPYPAHFFGVTHTNGNQMNKRAYVYLYSKRKKSYWLLYDSV